MLYYLFIESINTEGYSDELFFKLFDGEVGKIVNDSDWDYEKHCIIIDGIEYKLMDELNDIDSFIKEFNINLNDITLFKFEACRGEGCYSGYIKVNDKHYSLDVVNYTVYKIEPIQVN